LINSLRAMKAIYDVSFSDKPDAVKLRNEIKNDFMYNVEALKAGLNEPPAPKQALIRKPFKIMLAILLAFFLLTIFLSH